MIRLFVMLLLLASSQLQAHPLAPALLQLKQINADDYQVLWRTSITRVQGADVEPALPSQCASTAAAQTAMEEGEALVARWTIRCAAPGLYGGALTIRGLDRAGINVILHIEDLKGAVSETLLDARQASIAIPKPEAAPSVFGSYLQLGVQHLLTGFDHMLFVAGLFLLVRRIKPLLLTVTAFTLGHSITLALASLGFIHVNSELTELGIAISILVLATEVVRKDQNRSWLARRSWLMASSFGLLHGLGFAGALTEVGLPQGEIPLALLAFNIGIELGQILLLVGMLLLATTWKLLPSQQQMPRLQRLVYLPPSYLIGGLAAYWCFERAAVFLA
jgi:hydrogenase/urease accessory protein HupE